MLDSHMAQSAPGEDSTEIRTSPLTVDNQST